MAVLHVYFREKTGMRYQTDVRFGVEDFICKRNLSQLNIVFIYKFMTRTFIISIAAMGGLLGLGLGFSFISLIEILYFMFLRHHVRPPRKKATEYDDETTHANSSAEEGLRRLK